MRAVWVIHRESAESAGFVQHGHCAPAAGSIAAFPRFEALSEGSETACLYVGDHSEFPGEMSGPLHLPSADTGVIDQAGTGPITMQLADRHPAIAAGFVVRAMRHPRHDHQKRLTGNWFGSPLVAEPPIVQAVQHGAVQQPLLAAPPALRPVAAAIRALGKRPAQRQHEQPHTEGVSPTG
ncbi:hypothetical protein ONR57_09005 [Hoyosella sp. YIM 151337]|uniref:hypothetical protein n=1 Tax=Hoyosella sp. YIM 151337 TaxID=2992742 RepID=UPI0022360878|nr:hypothetical protein [Hoyosella sp. YIM 151337]MCW4353433.1 hypothetical protein [Hoyosella sp. YIM 151337]